MKNVLCAAFILFGFICVTAQEETITKEEFWGIHRNVLEERMKVFSGKSFRYIRAFEIDVEGIPETVDYKWKSTFERASPTVSYEKQEFSLGSENSKSEVIKIGSKTYTRKENEAWVSEIFAVKSSTETDLPLADNEIDRLSEYKFLGSQRLNNQTTNVYAVITRTKLIDPLTNKETIYNGTSKYYFGENGTETIETNVENRSGKKIFRFHSSIVWELDPGIKIEEPFVQNNNSGSLKHEQCSYPVYKLEEVETKPQIISKPYFSYTEAELLDKQPGNAVIEVVLCKTGKVTDIKVIKGLWYGLTAKANELVKRIKFEPGRKDGKLVSVKVRLFYNWQVY